jgi:hypothetical protein
MRESFQKSFPAEKTQALVQFLTLSNYFFELLLGALNKYIMIFQRDRPWYSSWIKNALKGFCHDKTQTHRPASHDLLMS